MIKGWYESKGFDLEDGEFLLSYDVFYKKDERFTPAMSRMAVSVYVQTWGIRLLEELKECKEEFIKEMKFEDSMFDLCLHVTSKPKLRKKIIEQNGMIL